MSSNWEIADFGCFLTEEDKAKIKSLPASLFQPSPGSVRKAKRWPLGQTVSEAAPDETATVEPAPLIPDSVQGNQQRSEIDGKRHPGRYF